MIKQKLIPIICILILTILFSSLAYAIESQEIEVTTGGGGDDECDNNNDCTSPNSPRCNLANGNCVGCNDDDQCDRFTGLQYCSTNGNCVECITNVGCSGNEICRNNICVEDIIIVTSCSSDATCISQNSEFRCIEGKCQQPPQTADVQEGIPEEQPFPVFNFYNIIISILMLFGYYIRKIYR